MILVTGAAGFIGFHVTRRLLREGRPVHGIDNLNEYYDVRLKRARLDALAGSPGFTFDRTDLADADAVEAAFDRHPPEIVLNLAAQAGVRYSLTNPRAYGPSNLTGFLHVLEGCRRHRVKHLVYASSSSVYGANAALPFSPHQNTDHPVSLYAATKKANELMAHSYSHAFGLPTTGARLFTVYGPWGRPDMALFSFTRAILEDRPIEVFGDGALRRGFTYIDDVVEGLVRLADRPARPDEAWRAERPDPAASSAPFRIYNLGNQATIEVGRLIDLLEDCLGRKARRVARPTPACEVLATEADVQDLQRDTGFSPSTPIEAGVRKFVDWYRDFYGV